MDKLDVILAAAGMWIFSDGLFSIFFYYGKPSWRGGTPQDWLHDHWIRAVRMVLGLALVALGEWGLR